MKNYKAAGLTRREQYEQKQRHRSILVAALSTIFVIVAIVIFVPMTPGWEKVQKSFFNGVVLSKTFPKLLNAFTVNIMIFAWSAPAIAVLGLPWMDGTRLMGFEIVGEAFLWNQVRRVANALFRIALGELTVQQVKEAIERPDLPVDFGVAPAQWLTLWGVAWEDEPLPPDQTTPLLTPPPIGRIAERTKKGRWQMAAQHEMKGLLYNEWASLGELPLVYRKDSQ